MTEKEALNVLTGNREDYNSYAKALNIAIRVLKEHIAVNDTNKRQENIKQAQRREREANNESN